MNQDNIIARLDNEEVLQIDKERGIKTPGIVSGVTYKDSNGNIKHKYETLVAYSGATVREKLKRQQERQDAVETLEEEIPEKMKEGDELIKEEYVPEDNIITEENEAPKKPARRGRKPKPKPEDSE